MNRIGLSCCAFFAGLVLLGAMGSEVWGADPPPPYIKFTKGPTGGKTTITGEGTFVMRAGWGVKALNLVYVSSTGVQTRKAAAVDYVKGTWTASAYPVMPGTYTVYAEITYIENGVSNTEETYTTPSPYPTVTVLPPNP